MAKTTTVKVTRNVDTSDSMLPGESPGGPEVPPPWEVGDQPVSGGRPRRPRRPRGALVVALSVLGGLLVIAGGVAGVVRVPYDTLSPGTAKDVSGVVKVEGHETYPADGEILYTTVSVREHISALQAFVGWLDPTTDVVPEKKVRGDIPPDQYRQMNVEAMSDSKTTAQVLALRHLGYTDLGAGGEVDAVVDGSPAGAVLKPDDVIVEIDGKPIKTSADAVAAIRARKAGDTLRMRIIRDGGAPTDVETVLAAAEDGSARLGVRLTTKVQLPFPIDIDSGSVVGPSAGLAYGLELLDILTPGELTGGVKVAATGELAPNGDIGPIGGIAQKVTTVKRSGARVFLVPKANEEVARAHAGDDLDVRGVRTYDEALEVLGSLTGSNALALAKPSPPA